MNTDKQLLLKNLSARLPYHVKVRFKYDILMGETTEELTPSLIEKFNNFSGELYQLKPYLRSMSSMTDEEKMYVNELIYDKDGLFLSPIPTLVINECDIDKYIDFCNSKHLD